MIARTDDLGPKSGDPLPNSTKVYLPGTLHPELRVPMREITLSPSRRPDGSTEENLPVRVYDTSGPWGDASFQGDVKEGLPALRKSWILARKDVEEYDGRKVTPKDNGYLSEVHAQVKENPRFPLENAAFNRPRPLRASAGHPVSQLWYARHGIITPEMEYIAIRENQGLEHLQEKFSAQASRNSLLQQHPGQSWGAAIPKRITPEFVRDEVAARARDHPRQHQPPGIGADDHRP
jgi:phosphomethylpyrimidine synthase